METEIDRVVRLLRDLVGEHEQRARTMRSATWEGGCDGAWGDARMALDAYDKYAVTWNPTSKNCVTVTMPATPTRDMLLAVRKHDTTNVDDVDEMHKRIGWLYSAWFVMVDAGAIRSDEKDKGD